ncbi:hypothetical protein ARALYDRAFT_474242, partial [Arabidopsis lyrata subsp. lyrata]
IQASNPGNTNVLSFSSYVPHLNIFYRSMVKSMSPHSKMTALSSASLYGVHHYPSSKSLTQRPYLCANPSASLFRFDSFYLELICSVEAILRMERRGIKPNKLTFPFLLKACASFLGLTAGPRKVFDEMTDRNFVSWNSTMTALVENGKFNLVFKCFCEMIGRRFCPDETTMYARLVFERMVDKNVWTWSAMIIFHTTLVDDRYKYFHDMEKAHKIKPMMIHYRAMVDILGRASRLNEAYDFINKMPFEPDAVVWRTLLSAC